MISFGLKFLNIHMLVISTYSTLRGEIICSDLKLKQAVPKFIVNKPFLIKIRM